VQEMSRLGGNHMKTLNVTKDWYSSKANTFWGEIAPTDHILQIYESDEVLVNTLAGFVGNGINVGDCCIIIATADHLTQLNKKLDQYGLHVPELIRDTRYIPLDAEITLSKFLIDAWPDSQLFNLTASEVLNKAKATGRRIRAFGEMVDILVERGHTGACIQLEYLWNKLWEKEPFSLMCAYNRSRFTEELNGSLSNICCAHSKIIGGTEHQLTNIVYRDLDRTRPESQQVLLAR
jgi:hypothetical protein